MTETRELRKVRVGKVVSDKMDKTIVVAIEDNAFNSDYTQSKVPGITKATITYNKIQRDFSISSVGYATYFTEKIFVPSSQKMCHGS